MAKKRIVVEVTYTYELEVDQESSCVKDYDTESGMIEDLVHYRFTTLPILGNGVDVVDVEVGDYSII